MESNIYVLIILTVSGVYVLMVPLIIYFEMDRRKEDKKRDSFLRHMHIESKKNSRETQRKIDENHRDATRIIENMQKESSLFLRMIFERVDGREENKD